MTTTNADLIEMIDIDRILKMSRYAGGHDEQMKGLLKDVIVWVHWNEGDYEGNVATIVGLETGEVVVYSDYYGSCSGCDAWEDASDEDVKRMCIQLAGTAKIFKNLKEAILFLKFSPKFGKTDFEFGDDVKYGLLKELCGENQELKSILIGTKPIPDDIDEIIKELRLIKDI